MSLRTSATRYAKALFEVAVAESDPGRIEGDLTTLVAAIADHSELDQVMTSPRVPKSVRVGVANAISEKAGVAAPVMKLVAMLVERGRLHLLPAVGDVYRERLLAHRNIVPAAVTSAAVLTPGQVELLTRNLDTLTGKQVQLALDVDPALMGGVVARIGSTVYDGSLRTQLRKLKDQLVEQA